MPTLYQLVRGCRKTFQPVRKSRLLKSCPQKKGICSKVLVVKPKKPNSANRKIARVRVISTNELLTAYIPGTGHTLQKYSTVLIRGGRVRDLPGVRYKLIRGCFDFKREDILVRGSKRSKYGAKKKK